MAKRRTYNMRTKYGCDYCADRKSCSDEQCRYASIMDPYGSWAEYDEEMANLCPSILIREERIAIGGIKHKYIRDEDLNV